MASAYLKTMLAALALATLPMPALAHGPDAHLSPIGEPGEPASVSREIEIVMNDRMRFVPASIAVKPGETVRFRVRNDGIEPHEFMLGQIADLQAHAAVMRKHPEMVHDEPNAITVLPGQSGDLVWRFAKAGKVDFACLIPGHFEAGMKGDIRVSK